MRTEFDISQEIKHIDKRLDILEAIKEPNENERDKMLQLYTKRRALIWVLEK